MTNSRRNFDADRVPGWFRMRDRQDYDEARFKGSITCRDEACRAILALLLSRRRLTNPQIVVPNDQTRFGFRQHGKGSLQQIVEMLVLWSHFGAANCVDHGRAGLVSSEAPLGRCRKPVKMIGRHQHPFSPSMPSDLNRLIACLMLKFAEFALEFDCGGSGHRYYRRIAIGVEENIRIIRIFRMISR